MALGKLKDLARRAGRWLGLVDTPAPVVHTGAVVADRFDAMAWTDIYDQAAALRELADDLTDRYDYAADLLQDVWLGAYKASPQLRERADMDPRRLLNHQVVTALISSAEWAELHRETAGDPYAAAMAVLAQAATLRRLLEETRNAGDRADEAAAAQRELEQAAQAVADALHQAGEQAGDDGGVPDKAGAAVAAAIQGAEHAEQTAARAAAAVEEALAAAGPVVRPMVRQAAAEAAKAVGEEAALMAAWGIEPGQLQRMSYEQRAELARRLRGGRLGRFAQLIGRFRRMADAARARRIEHVPGELIGVTLGDDLSLLVPAEMTNLAVPALRGVFAARYADAQLMIYDSVGEIEAGQGAIIAAVDCSASMTYAGPHGISGEAWAKACALALLDQARHSRRDFVGILFSSPGEIQVFRFPAAEPIRIDDVLDFAEIFFCGGTDFETPLTAAVDLLGAEYNAAGKQRGDIVLITDGECEVGEEWMRGWRDAKQQLGFRLFGVAIDAHQTAPGGTLDVLSDNLRSIGDLTDVHATSDMFRLI
jgi:uncharacterized protein with von Willebrand factor type A (vWA) domain